MDERLSTIITQSVERLLATLHQSTPQIQPQVQDWMRSLAGGHAPDAYFKHPLAFPTLLLPWWVEQSFGQSPSLELHSDIAYSSINGYYFIRMIDNVMDGETTIEKALLPALGFFHTEFQSAYQTYFPASHPFWELYKNVWFGAHQAAILDAQLREIDLYAFENMASQKVSAARIPAAAICHHYGRTDTMEDWFEWVRRFGKWHQMFNDVFDWYKDSSNGNQTYFLSEAERLKRADESAIQWIVREGFESGCDTLRLWMKETQDLAATLNCPELVQYLEKRSALFEERTRNSLEGLQALGKLVMVSSTK
ncbi:MAG: hypothetical protein HYZ22_10145 [Chloroflexi bacterium]|nr:hypothetical protein [Chloroflexota bacterium]